MGIYFNPDNESFSRDKNNDIYVDKTGLLEFLNERLETNNNCILVSRARGFGKSHATRMIDAYYNIGRNSAHIFQDTKIALSKNYKKHMNKYHVIYLDMSLLWKEYKNDILEKMTENIFKELRNVFGEELEYKFSLSYTLATIYQKTGIPFVIIIDEWDYVIRKCDDKELVDRYLRILHSLFKTFESRSFLALGYMTGILPMKRMKDESGLNNFEEFSMLDSYKITQYYGFTEDEVKMLCEKYNMDFEVMKEWYKGYRIGRKHVMYNPHSVLMALKQCKVDFYWKKTSSSAMLASYIAMNYSVTRQIIVPAYCNFAAD